jgi:hypothetical protein
METADEKNDKVEKLSEVKVERKENKSKASTEDKYLNLVTVAGGIMGLATFDVKDMILSGTVTIDGKDWRPTDGNFDIQMSEIDGKEVEITSFPKSIKFTLDSKALNEYRTSEPN